MTSIVDGLFQLAKAAQKGFRIAHDFVCFGTHAIAVTNIAASMCSRVFASDASLGLGAVVSLLELTVSSLKFFSLAATKRAAIRDLMLTICLCLRLQVRRHTRSRPEPLVNTM